MKLSEYCFDYCFPGDAFGCAVAVLVGTERLTGMKFGTVVPTKARLESLLLIGLWIL